MLSIRGLLRVPIGCLVRTFAVSYRQIEETVKEKGRGDEDVYFNRRDRMRHTGDLLKKILEKVDKTVLEPQEMKEVEERSRSALLSLAKTHNVRLSDVVMEDLLKWRRGEY